MTAKGEFYTCAVCEGKFKRIRDEQEAVNELHELFGEIPIEDCVLVCDACFEVIRPDKQTKH